MGNLNYKPGLFLSFLKLRSLKWVFGFLCLFPFQFISAQNVLPPSDSYISIDNSIV